MKMLIQKEKDYRIYSIDSLKGIAMIMIIITHYSWSGNWRNNPIFPFVIDLAVPVMMFCTGCLWAIRCQEQDIYDDIRNIKKIVRLAIPYIPIFAFEVYMGFSSGNVKTLIEVVNLFVVGGYGPGAYYFPVMIQIIFLFPLIYGFVSRRGGIIICFLFNLLFELCKNAFYVSEETYRLCSFRYTFVIACGCYCYLNRNEIRNNWKSKRNSVLLGALCMLLIGGCYILITSYGFYNPIILNYWTGTSLLSTFYIIPFVLAFICFSPRIRLFEMVGKWSWGIFLIQKVFYYYFSSFLYERLNRTWKRLTINLIIIVVLGTIYEKSCLSLRKKIGKILNSRYFHNK